MNIIKLISDLSTEEEYLKWMESQTDAQLEELWKPCWNVTRPEPRMAKEISSNLVTKDSLKKDTKNKLAMLGDEQKNMLASLGFGDLLLKNNNRKK